MSPSVAGGAHGSAHPHGSAPDADVRYLAVALALLSAFLAAELAAAVLAHSLALFSDAGHMLTDVVALAGSVWAARLAARPPHGMWTYGLKRAEVLSAVGNGVTLVAIAAVIAVESARRLLTPPPVQGGVVLGVALLGAAVNVLITAVLARAERSSINVRGVYLHILTDLYAFGATAAAGLVIVLAGWKRADAVAALAVAALMLRAAWSLLREAGLILLEAAPADLGLEEVRTHLGEVAHVLDVHDLHAWTVSSGLPTLSAHVVLDDRCFQDGHAPQVLDQLQSCLAGHFDVTHSTFQLEPASHAEHEHPEHR